MFRQSMLVALASFLMVASSAHGLQVKSEQKKDEMKNPALLDPKKATETAPDQFQVKFETTKGEFVVEVTREWAPNGADRFYNLVKAGYYDEVAFFRVMSGFMAQFGISGDPQVSKVWSQVRIKDDEVKQSNTRGMITFAMAGPDTRTTQIFINASSPDVFDEGAIRFRFLKAWAT